MAERLQPRRKFRRAVATGVAVTLLAVPACAASEKATETFRASTKATVTDVTTPLPIVDLNLGDYSQPPYEHHGTEKNGNKKVIQSLTKKGPFEIEIANRDKDAGTNCVEVFVPKGKIVTALAAEGGTTAQKRAVDIYTFCNRNMKLRSTSAVAEAQ